MSELRLTQSIDWLSAESCYERMDITGLSGITAVQPVALRVLGAVDRTCSGTARAVLSDP